MHIPPLNAKLAASDAFTALSTRTHQLKECPCSKSSRRLCLAGHLRPLSNIFGALISRCIHVMCVPTSNSAQNDEAARRAPAEVEAEAIGRKTRDLASTPDAWCLNTAAVRTAASMQWSDNKGGAESWALLPTDHACQSLGNLPHPMGCHHDPAPRECGPHPHRAALAPAPCARGMSSRKCTRLRARGSGCPLVWT